MPLGMKVGLGTGDFVLDGDPAPPKRGHNPPEFSAHFYCGQKGWMDQDASWYRGRPGPWRHCVRCGRSPMSASADLLYGGAMSFINSRVVFVMQSCEGDTK